MDVGSHRAADLRLLDPNAVLAEDVLMTFEMVSRADAGFCHLSHFPIVQDDDFDTDEPAVVAGEHVLLKAQSWWFQERCFCWYSTHQRISVYGSCDCLTRHIVQRPQRVMRLHTQTRTSSHTHTQIGNERRVGGG